MQNSGDSQSRFSKSMMLFALLFIVLEVGYGLLYGFQYSYIISADSLAIIGQTTTVGLLMLLLVGFGLFNTYINRFSISGMFFTLLILAVTIQHYFLVRSFWLYTGIERDDLVGGFLEKQFDQISLVDMDDRSSNSVSSTTSFNELFACAISMWVALLPNLGKIGPLHIFIMCFIGQFVYTLNQSVLWTLDIQDTGSGMKVFLFGSIMGLVSSVLLDKKDLTKNSDFYYSARKSQIFALIGTTFVWCFLPWISLVYQTKLFNSSYLEITPINMYLALCASCGATFATSCLLNQKISIHDVVFSSFTGAIAYASSADLMVNPFPAMLIGLLSGVIVTVLNSKAKKPLNSLGVIDSNGALFTFLVPSLLGAIYSAILVSIGAQNSNLSVREFNNRARFGQGGYQMIGLAVTIALSLVAGIIIGVIFRVSSPAQEYDDFFLDQRYVKTNLKNQAMLSQIQQTPLKDK